MSITATELKKNLGRYLMLSATEDIYITKNGKVVAKLSKWLSLFSVYFRRIQLLKMLKMRG